MRRILLASTIVILTLFALAAGAVYWFLSGDGIRLALEAQSSAWLGQPVHIGSARAQLLPRIAIGLRDVRVGDPARLTLARVDVSTDLRALLSRRIERADLIIADSVVQMPLPFAIPTTESRPANPSTAPGGGVQLVSIRAIALENVRITSRGHEITLSADSSLTGNDLQLRRFTASSGRTSLEASGLVQLAPRVDATLKVRANRLDVDELLALADAFSSPPTRTTQTARRQLPVRITARLSAERASAGGIDVRQFATDFQLEGDTVTLSPVTFQFFGGKYQGALNATLGTTLALALQSRITDLDVAQLATFGGVPNTVTGRLTGAGSLSGRGQDVSAVLRSARGNGTASIVNGTIQRLNMVRTVVLFFGRPAADAPAGTDHFDRLDATFSLAQEVVHAEALSLHSSDVDLVGAGTLTVPTKALDGRIDLSLSEALSAQAGTDLYRYTREQNRIVLPARVGGTLDGPRLTIDAAAAAKRGLRNEIDRRLKGLLDRFGGNRDATP